MTDYRPLIKRFFTDLENDHKIVYSSKDKDILIHDLNNLLRNSADKRISRSLWLNFIKFLNNYNNKFSQQHIISFLYDQHVQFIPMLRIYNFHVLLGADYVEKYRLNLTDKIKCSFDELYDDLAEQQNYLNGTKYYCYVYKNYEKIANNDLPSDVQDYLNFLVNNELLTNNNKNNESYFFADKIQNHLLNNSSKHKESFSVASLIVSKLSSPTDIYYSSFIHRNNYADYLRYHYFFGTKMINYLEFLRVNYSFTFGHYYYNDNYITMPRHYKYNENINYIHLYLFHFSLIPRIFIRFTEKFTDEGENSFAVSDSDYLLDLMNNYIHHIYDLPIFDVKKFCIASIIPRPKKYFNKAYHHIYGDTTEQDFIDGAIDVLFIAETAWLNCIFIDDLLLDIKINYKNNKKEIIFDIEYYLDQFFNEKNDNIFTSFTTGTITYNYLMPDTIKINYPLNKLKYYLAICYLVNLKPKQLYQKFF